MSFTIGCPSCQRTLRVPENLLGQAVKCPTCSHTFTAPESVEEEAPRRPVSVPASERPSRRPAPPPEDDYDDEPRPSKRRARAGDYDDDYDDDAPRSRRSRREKPSKVQALGIMVLVGGIIALLYGVSGLAVGIATCIGLLWPGTYYALVLGIMAIIKGAALLGEKAHRQPSPQGIGIMMIINAINCDVVNLALGIVVLVFLGDEEVKDYFRS